MADNRGTLDLGAFKTSESTDIVPYYPSNNGAITGTEEMIMLMPGDKIDRYGGEGGTFFGKEGTPLEMRALPPNANTSQYRVYEVLKSFEVEKAVIKPAFGKIGLGIQYHSSMSADELRRSGYLELIEEIISDEYK